MDEKNGEVFDHHVELFSGLGNSSSGDPLRDFLLNSTKLIESNVTAKTVSVPVSQTSCATSQSTMWTQDFPQGSQTTGVLGNNNRSGFSCPPLSGPSVELLQSEVANTSALFDSLVKSLPGSESVLDQYSSLYFSNKNVNNDSKVPSGDISNHMSNSFFGSLCRINSEKVTHDLLENFNKLDSSDLLLKCGSGDYMESMGWNGLVCGAPNSLNFQTQNKLVHGFQNSIDKNGNTALFNTSHMDKMAMGNLADTFGTQNNFMTRLSPSASVETSVRTPATSYESASPLSNNRTPIRSDESISPMGSGHTPLRVEESTSPLTNIKTPLRIEEGSPIGRTPSRIEESYSPVGSSSSLPTSSNSPSHKANGTLQGFDTYSPPSGFRKLGTKSPTSGVQLAATTVKVESLGSPSKREETDSLAAYTNRICDGKDAVKGIFPTECKDGAKVLFNSKDFKALIKQHTKKTIPMPLVCAQHVENPIANKKSAKRTLSKKDDGTKCSGRQECSSSLLEKNETDSTHLEEVEASNVKTEFSNIVPEVEGESKGELIAQSVRTSFSGEVTYTDEFFNLSKKRRKKCENLKTGAIIGSRRKNRKKVTIYQSSMSPEETGIKLKIKVASAFQTIKPQKKRRSRKQYESDEDTEETEGGSKGRSRKIVKFFGGTKESGVTEQTEWGSKIPPNVLQKIFEMVVEEQGCVPSLVRFSYVCKLWNSVASRPELWRNIDLSSPYIKQKCKIDRYFRWLLENRLDNIRELNLGGWKFSNITMILSLIETHCTEIESIGLGGWQGLHYEHLKSLLKDCPRLAKLDLSDVSPESKSANSAVSQKSITFLTQTMGERLTQLILAHNTLTCLPQIISSLATHCPNLQVLDLSNIRRVSHTEFALNIEHLQEGCQKLKVLRITNSCITLANVPLEKQVASPGFTNLEELSIAGHQGTESLRITSVMDDNCLERILKTSHKLKLLDVRGCTRVTDSSLVRVPAWDIQHLFLSGCYVTRQCGSGLELIAQKWSHSLVEVDLAWTTVTDDLNAAIMAFAEKGSDSPLRVMNLCGSSVTLEPVKALLSKCTNLESLNLQSCRGLPRGVKRLYENEQLNKLRIMLEKRERDSGGSDGEDRREAECTKESPKYSTNSRNDDLFI